MKNMDCTAIMESMENTESTVSTDKYTVASFYKFVNFSAAELGELKSSLWQSCHEKGIFGTILLATEGVNGTISGFDNAIQFFLQELQSNPKFDNIDPKFTYSAFIPFKKLKVSRKKEIVTFKVEGINPSQKTGVEIDASRWNEIISDPEILLIDTRNSFEFEQGTFKGAHNPNTRKFSDFPNFVQKTLDPNKHRKIAMFCTGGIRCEKASSYLLQQGFETVYQLKGGILKYLESVPTENSLWEGKCFVFDDRIVL